ncbi:hypothetical protein CONLIGDRAFT_570165, partial [Coniochaeta ligniaria NRRL 30616]
YIYFYLYKLLNDFYITYFNNILIYFNDYDLYIKYLSILFRNFKNNFVYLTNKYYKLKAK